MVSPVPEVSRVFSDRREMKGPEDSPDLQAQSGCRWGAGDRIFKEQFAFFFFSEQTRMINFSVSCSGLAWTSW